MRYSILLLFFLTSCLKPDCDLLVNDARTEECAIVISKIIDSSSFNFHAEGLNPENKLECECKTHNRWWGFYSKYMEAGDTLVKRKGETVLSIHKRDTILRFPYECEGKTYR